MASLKGPVEHALVSKYIWKADQGFTCTSIVLLFHPFCCVGQSTANESPVHYNEQINDQSEGILVPTLRVPLSCYVIKNVAWRQQRLRSVPLCVFLYNKGRPKHISCIDIHKWQHNMTYCVSKMKSQRSALNSCNGTSLQCQLKTSTWVNFVLNCSSVIHVGVAFIGPCTSSILIVNLSGLFQVPVFFQNRGALF